MSWRRRASHQCLIISSCKAVNRNNSYSFILPPKQNNFICFFKSLLLFDAISYHFCQALHSLLTWILLFTEWSPLQRFWPSPICQKLSSWLPHLLMLQPWTGLLETTFGFWLMFNFGYPIPWTHTKPILHWSVTFSPCSATTLTFPHLFGFLSSLANWIWDIMLPFPGLRIWIWLQRNSAMKSP